MRKLICGCFGDIGGEEVAKVHAQLFAAAPELIEAAEAVLAWWDKFVPTTNHAKQPEIEDAEFEEFLTLRRVLARARGK